ncbi:MAG: ABC transporter ATP-binding protein [Myxococcota bacterium]
MQPRTALQKPAGSAWPIFVRTSGLFRPFRRQLAVVVFLIAVTSTLDLLPWLVIQRIVDEAVPGTGDLTRIHWLLGAILAIYLTSALLGVLRGYLNQVVGQNVMLNLREVLHEHLQKLSVRFYTQTRAGEILSRVTADVNAVQDAVTGTFTMFLIHLVTLCVAVGLMFSLDWRLAVLMCLVLPPWVWPTVRVGNRMRQLQLEWRDEAAGMTSHLAETLSVSGSMLVKSFGRQELESERFDRANRELRSLSLQRFMAGRWFNTGTQLFGSFAVGFVYWYGATGVVSGDIPTVGVVVAFAGLSQRVFMPFRQIARINTTVLTSLALFERIFEYLDLPVEVADQPGARSLPRPRGALAFDDVTFRYSDEGPPAIDGMSFQVEPGQMVALVGPSGAGKTTVTYLLQRFYEPQQGRVLLDGHDLRDLTLDSVSGAVGAVMQDTYLFHASLAENIRYGRLDAMDEQMWAATTAAGMDDMIEELPAGLETVVGERGHRLSGGQKQRVAIARAILKDPPILILDEATASLDTRLEREIHKATLRLAEGRTTLIIAHRLSTVLAADVILVLDRGRIVEAGSHEELLRHGGLYAALHHHQFAEEPPATERGALAAAEH